MTEMWHPSADAGHDLKADSTRRLNGKSSKSERRGSELLYSKIRILVRTRVVQTFSRLKKEDVFLEISYRELITAII